MTETTRVALLGGSFDPPHMAHVLTVAYGLSACPVDQVWLLPVWRHAFDKPLTDYAHRRRMLELAIAPFGARASVCDAERDLGTTSRTIDTVRHLQGRWPQHGFSLLMGADLFAERHLWKEFAALEALVEMHVLGRPGHPSPPEHPAGPTLPDISSTEIRRRVARGESLQGLVPRAVAEYIHTRGLYRA